MIDERDDEQEPQEPDEWAEFMAEYAFEQAREADDYLPPEFDEAFEIPQEDPFEDD